mmetsp:Transcript_22589/g.43116  ORF Transcript_22589/g.43116 Transcript_22589/m.43116 type:complete len:715 (+) Transcript_22589:19-2163(+)
MDTHHEDITQPALLDEGFRDSSCLAKDARSLGLIKSLQLIRTERGFQSEAEGDKADACAPNHISLNGRDEQDKNEEHDRRWAVMLRWRLFRDRLMDSHLIDEILEGQAQGAHSWLEFTVARQQLMRLQINGKVKMDMSKDPKHVKLRWHDGKLKAKLLPSVGKGEAIVGALTTMRQASMDSDAQLVENRVEWKVMASLAREHASFYDVTRKLWNNFPRISVDGTEFVEKHRYIKWHYRMTRMLCPSVQYYEMRANSENEWKEDMERAACDPETDSMGYAAFHCAFFQLAQLWVNHLHVPDLVKFLETFLPVTRCLFASDRELLDPIQDTKLPKYADPYKGIVSTIHNHSSSDPDSQLDLEAQRIAAENRHALINEHREKVDRLAHSKAVFTTPHDPTTGLFLDIPLNPDSDDQQAQRNGSGELDSSQMGASHKAPGVNPLDWIEPRSKAPKHPNSMSQTFGDVLRYLPKKGLASLFGKNQKSDHLLQGDQVGRSASTDSVCGQEEFEVVGRRHSLDSSLQEAADWRRDRSGNDSRLGLHAPVPAGKSVKSKPRLLDPIGGPAARRWLPLESHVAYSTLRTNAPDLEIGGTTFASSSGATANAKPRRLGALPQKGTEGVSIESTHKSNLPAQILSDPLSNLSNLSNTHGAKLQPIKRNDFAPEELNAIDKQESGCSQLQHGETTVDRLNHKSGTQGLGEGITGLSLLNMRRRSID